MADLDFLYALCTTFYWASMQEFLGCDVAIELYLLNAANKKSTTEQSNKFQETILYTYISVLFYLK